MSGSFSLWHRAPATVRTSSAAAVFTLRLEKMPKPPSVPSLKQFCESRHVSVRISAVCWVPSPPPLRDANPASATQPLLSSEIFISCQLEAALNRSQALLEGAHPARHPSLPGSWPRSQTSLVELVFLMVLQISPVPGGSQAKAERTWHVSPLTSLISHSSRDAFLKDHRNVPFKTCLVNFLDPEA